MYIQIHCIKLHYFWTELQYLTKFLFFHSCSYSFNETYLHKLISNNKSDLYYTLHLKLYVYIDLCILGIEKHYLKKKKKKTRSNAIYFLYLLKYNIILVFFKEQMYKRCHRDIISLLNIHFLII